MINKVFSILEKSKNVAIFTHMMPDGDALGSSFSLKKVLEKMGKKADLYIVDAVPQRLKFLGSDYKTEYKEEGYDLMVALDCGDLRRIHNYADVFDKHENTLSIDHHASNGNYAKENYVVPDASSTGEVLYEIFKENNVEIDEEISALLYASIASDTGCFKFSNTKAKVHKYASELIEKGIDYAEINRLLFDTEEIVSYKLKGYAMSKVKLYENGKIGMVTITKEELDSLGASYEHTEGLSDVARVIEGVEVGVVIKENNDKFKISIRTNRYVDATKIAEKFDGGGHIRAAGCVSYKNIEETEKELIDVITKLL